jgi:hypothetical protein
MITGSMTAPKTKEEKWQEKLREVNARLCVVKNLIGEDHESIKKKIELAEGRKRDASGKARFVKINSTMIEGNDHLSALIELETHYDMLLDIQAKNPLKETINLLEKKIKLLKKLIGN